MKHLSHLFLFILVIAACSSAIQAKEGDGGQTGGSKQSWQDIMKNPNLFAQFASYPISGHRIRYDHLCFHDGMVRTKYKQQSNHHTYEYLYTSSTYEHQECISLNSGICVEWQSITYTIPLKSEIEVFNKKAIGQPWPLAFKKEFELKECINW